jgi:hypothetical protein
VVAFMSFDHDAGPPGPQTHQQVVAIMPYFPTLVVLVRDSNTHRAVALRRVTLVHTPNSTVRCFTTTAPPPANINHRSIFEYPWCCKTARLPSA